MCDRQPSGTIRAMPLGSRVHLSVEYVRRVVVELYRRVLADPVLAPWFEGVDLGSLRAHQTEFLLAALGAAPDQVSRPERLRARLRDAHRGLAIDHHAYDRAVGHLEAALTATGMGAEQCGEVLGVVRGLAPQVVELSEAGGPDVRETQGDPTRR